MDIETDR